MKIELTCTECGAMFTATNIPNSNPSTPGTNRFYRQIYQADDQSKFIAHEKMHKDKFMGGGEEYSWTVVKVAGEENDQNQK